MRKRTSLNESSFSLIMSLSSSWNCGENDKMGDGTPHNSDDIGAPGLSNAWDGLDDGMTKASPDVSRGCRGDDAAHARSVSATGASEGRMLAVSPMEEPEETR